MELNRSRWLQPSIERLGDLGRCPNQNVGVPNRCHPEFRVGADFDPDIADLVLDGREPRFLGQAEEGPLHRIPLIANRNIRKARGKQIRLMVAPRWRTPHHVMPAVVNGETSAAW